MGKCQRLCGMPQKLLRLGNTASDARGLGINREWKVRREVKIALYAKTERAFHGFQFGKADAAKFREAKAKIAKPE